MLVARDDVPVAAIRIYELAFLTGFGVSTLIYVSLNYFFPPRGVSIQTTRLEEIDETGWEDGMRPADHPTVMYGDRRKAGSDVEIMQVHDDGVTKRKMKGDEGSSLDDEDIKATP